MSYGIELDNNSIILRTIEVDDNFTQEDLDELTSQISPNVWVLISNAVKVPAKDMYYDSVSKLYYFPKPYPSWIWDETLTEYVPPVPYPGGKTPYEWDEETQSWIPIVKTQGENT